MKGWITAILTVVAALSPTVATAQDDPAAVAQEKVESAKHSRRLNPTVFQAAGPDAASIQGTVDQFRAAIGGGNNGNAPGPVKDGRREINWDGGGSTATAVSGTPFDGFLNIRGARFATDGTGFVQAPASGLAAVFANSQYESIFAAFSPVRLFSPIDSNFTRVQFFIPGGNGAAPARTRAFGAVFTDVDTPDGSTGSERRKDDTTVEYLDRWGRVLFRGVVASSPGNATFSFFGVVLEDADIASVRIVAGDTPGRDDSRRNDVVMMDDFIYAEPQPASYSY